MGNWKKYYFVVFVEMSVGIIVKQLKKKLGNVTFLRMNASLGIGEIGNSQVGILGGSFIFLGS